MTGPLTDAQQAATEAALALLAADRESEAALAAHVQPSSRDMLYVAAFGQATGHIHALIGVIAELTGGAS